MKGESLSSSFIDPHGLLGDRVYALLDVERNVLASAKNPQRWGQLLGYRARYSEEPVPGASFPPVIIEAPDGTELRSTDPGIDAELTRRLGIDVRLVTASEVDGAKGYELVWTNIDGAAPEEWKEKTAVGTQGDETLGQLEFGMLAPDRFFDMSVLHVLTTSSLEYMSSVAEDSTFDPRRYRPNIFIETPEVALLENEWVGQVIEVGGVRAPVSMPAVRCVMTTLGQDELPTDRGTLRAVTKYNRQELPGGIGAWACMGVYADVIGTGRISVGETFSITEARPGELVPFSV
jgi:uncharacterized protein YcbX